MDNMVDSIQNKIAPEIINDSYLPLDRVVKQPEGFDGYGGPEYANIFR